MSDSTSSQPGAQDPRSNRPPLVPLGAKMPMSGKKVPVLQPLDSPEGIQRTEGQEQTHSEIADGLNFVGNAQFAGVCTVRGRVEGNLQRARGARASVVVTETGLVKGDIIADAISVMGRTEGLLDGSGGSVTLHENANISGHVRYAKIQVNGSDLNATLERAMTQSLPRAGSGPEGSR